MDRSKWIKWAPFVVLAGVIFILSKALLLNPNKLPEERIGEPLPKFSMPLLSDLEQPVTEEDLPKEPMIIHVWATWCGICRKEFPLLNELKTLGVPMIGINYRDDPAQAQLFLDKSGDPFVKNLVDLSGKFGLDLGIYGTPETYIVDSKGKLRYRHVGIIDDQQDIDELMAALDEIKQEES